MLFYREVKKEHENYHNPEQQQNERARLMEEELRKDRKRKALISEGHGAGYSHATRVPTGGRRPGMNAAYMAEDSTGDGWLC